MDENSRPPLTTLCKWTLHPVPTGLGAHAAAWDALADRLYEPNPMLRSGFVDSLLRHFGDSSVRLCVLGPSESPRAMGLLQPSGSTAWRTFLPSQAQIGPMLLPTPAEADRLFSALPALVGAVDFLCNDPSFGDLSDIDNRHRASKDHALTMSIQLDGDFGAYWAGRSKKLVSNLGRHERRMAADGRTAVTTVTTDPTELKAAVDRYAQLESAGWKAEAGTALTSGGAQTRFYHEILDRFGASGEAISYELWIDDRVAASRLGIATKNTLVMLKTTYDESLAQYAPGRVLLREAISDAFTRFAGGRIEFYTDATPDQLSWATHKRWIRHVSFYRSARIATLLAVLRSLAYAMRLSFGTETISPSKVDIQIDSHRHPDEFPPDLIHFLTTQEGDKVESSAPWFQNLQDAVFPKHAGVRYYVARRAGLPIVLLPVLVGDGGSRSHEATSFTNYYSTLYAPAVAEGGKEEDLAAVLDFIRRAHRPLRSFRFAPMDSQSVAYRRLLNALRLCGLAPFQFFCFGNWYLQVGATWSDYLTERKGGLRSTLKRMGRKFEKADGRLETLVGASALDRGAPAFLSVYANSWKVPEPYPDFIPGLMHACARQASLRVGVAWLGETPIAAQFWITHGGTASIYKVAYDEAHKAFAPGTLLTAHMIQHAIEQDHVHTVDFLIGDDTYKKDWMSHRRERWGIIAYDPRTLMGLIGLLRESGQRLAKQFMSSTPLTPEKPASERVK